ncbi:MAG: TolC family protein [Deltaproteobacteria bacterium]|nr:TolC family protein [Deltaproteobacteria bacterium]
MFAAAAAFLLLPPSIFAAESITLHDAFRMAMETHEAVSIAGEGVEQARAGQGKALSKFLPELKVEGGYTRYSGEKTVSGFLVQPESSSRVDVTVTQPLFEGGKNLSGRRQAELVADRSRIGLNAAKEGIVRQTARAYYGVLKAESDIEIKDAALKRALERRKVAEARFRVGEVTKSAVLRAEAEVAGAEAEATRAGAVLRDSMNILKRLTGAEGELELIRPEPLKPVEASPEELIARSLDSRRDYRQSLIDEKVAGEGISSVKGEFLPSLNLEGNYNWRSQNPSTTFLLENSASAALVLSYPIFEGGLRRAELSEARSRLRESGHRRLSLKRDIGVQVMEAYNDMAALDSLIESFRRQVAFAEEDYRMVFEQFKHGIATTVDVIDADTNLIEAQSSLASSVYDREVSIIELRYAVGTLLDYVSMEASRVQAPFPATTPP